jgi:phage gp16-like protein
METPRQKDRRYRLYAMLQVAKAQLGMEDADYRTLLARHGAKAADGKISATTMDFGGLIDAIDEMKSKGFRPKGKSIHNAADWRKPRIAKITAIWCALADAGVIKNRSEASMLKFCARITHKARLEWAQSEDLNNCIQALRAWAKNSGVVLAE